MQSKHTPRLPRFKRVNTLPDIDLTEHDREIIRIVNRHRFVDSSQISAMIGGSAQQTVRRLQLLYHRGFLERPRCQIDYYHRGGSRKIVYGIGRKGAAMLSEEGVPMNEIRWGEKNRAVGRVYLEHALFVSEVMQAIQFTCREKGIRLLYEDELSMENRNGMRHSFRWKVNLSSTVKLGVVPDRVFALEFTTKQGTVERRYFFLEADRGTMPVIRQNLLQTSFYRKLLAYEATWKQSLHVSRFGFHRFRVLTVTSSTSRLASLIEACSQLESGQGIFLFADRSSLETPENILSAIWINGRGEIDSLLN